MSKRKHCAYTLEFKLKMISEVDDKRLTKTEICKKHSIPNSTLSTILKDRENLQKACEDTKFRPSTKKMKKWSHEELEEAVFLWFRAMNVPLSGPVVVSKAAKIARMMDIEFTPTPSWVEKFKQPRGITFRVISGEAAAAPKEEAQNWAYDDLQKILTRYAPANVYNADETKALKDETCTGGKKSKSCLTVLLATNMDGSDKLPPLVIGKSKNPISFKHVKTLLVAYKNNKKAWMTSQLFEEWLRKLNRKFVAQKRKIAMVVNNCPAHPKTDDLEPIELVFLLLNTTSLLQPCDQGIIKVFKQIYRKLMVPSYQFHVEEQIKGRRKDQVYNVNTLDALHQIRGAWPLVQQQCIANCFRHACFVVRDDSREEQETMQSNGEDVVTDDLGNIFTRLSDLIYH